VIVSILVTFLLLTLVPIVLMVVLSLKDNGQIYGRFWSLPNPIRWPNYQQGVEVMAGYIKNSLLYSMLSTTGVVFVSRLATSRQALVSVR
jgi:ABC-type glycerol-3-phosphate transport system permease component